MARSALDGRALGRIISDMDVALLDEFLLIGVDKS